MRQVCRRKIPSATLEEILNREGAKSLAAAALNEGDAARGAVLFHQRRTACNKCHATGNSEQSLGPDLAKPDKKPAVEFLVESVLRPSKDIPEKYQAVQILTDEGQLLTGLIASETADEVELRDASRPENVESIKKKHIDTRVNSKASLMPSGVVNQLADRQQFLDLVRYVAEISEYGPERARELDPSPEQLETIAEIAIDHMERIRELSPDDVATGRRLYRQYCSELSWHGWQ